MEKKYFKMNYNYGDEYYDNYEGNYYDDYEDDYEDEDYYYDDYDDDYYSNYNYYDNYDDYDYEDYKYQEESIENKYRFDNKNSFTQLVDKTINPNPYTDINDNFVRVLMIAEKPSIAKTIAKILSTKKSFNDFSKKNGWCLYTFNGIFKGKNAHFSVSSVAGHLYGTEFLRMHQNVNAIKPEELFDVPTVKTENNDSSFSIIDNLKNLANNKDILCLWLDCDREGENICYEVIHNTLPFMNKKDYQQIYRALFSSLTKEDIKKSFNELANYPDNKLSLSVDAREVIDLKVGVSLTRFLTANIRPHLPYDVKSNIISYGPCQTPTLWFCVNRQRQIENTKNALTYFKIFIEVKFSGENIKIFLDGEFKDKNEVNKIISEIKKNKCLKVKDLISENKTLPHPSALNTATMLKIASSELKISPNKTMHLAENLYMDGYITYPRTETTKYSKTFDFKNNLKKFENSPIFGDDINELISEFDDNSLLDFEGIDMGDHPPITPSRMPQKNKLKGEEYDLFKLICNYYFATLSPSIKYDKINYIFKIGNKDYNAESSFIEKLGFLKFLPFKNKNFIESKNKLKLDNEYQIENISYEERVINDYITEAELIEEMEKNHIGTDASMSVHIENIERRGYVRVDDKRRLIPTKLGKALIESLESIEKDIVLPENRAKIEEFVAQLANGEKNYEEVLDYALKFYKNKFHSISEKVEQLYKIFGKYFNLVDEEY